MSAVFPSSESNAASKTIVPAARWQVQLLGGLRLGDGRQYFTRLPSRAVTALLARLALWPARAHSREELVELIWPGVALGVGRNRLRQALSTLKGLLEPAGGVPSPVLLADRLSLRVVDGALACDAVLFEQALRAGRHADAHALYGGELLPGFYDEWIDAERQRFAALRDRLDAEPQAPAATPVPTQRAARNAMPSPAHDASSRRALPVYLTRFFGREGESARLRAEVLGHRLVTLLGPGGSGKTRLAVELAAGLAADVSPMGSDPPFDLVAFVPLASCETRAQLLDAVLGALLLTSRGDDAFAALDAALSGRRVLLVLDNFEQLVGRADDVVARLGASLPGLHLLVTSRRVLGLDGERECGLQPLQLPASDLPLHEAAINPAVALFGDRARAARADFRIGARNIAALIELAHLLEGLPLAIELAAARVRSMAPADIAALLRAARAAPGGDALELLARGGPRSGHDPRHASMLRVIEWSWRLLDPAQARLLAALAVLHGGFTAAAALAVCGGGTAGIALQLDALVTHSLLRADAAEDGSATRYAHFEPIREYGATQLDAATARTLRARHRAWLTTWAQTLPATPSLPDLRAEMPNLLAALASALADEVPDAAVQLMLPLRRVLEDVELPADGMALLEAAVERCENPALRSRGHTLLGPLLFVAGRGTDALRHAEQGLRDAPPDALLRARALHAAARVRWRTTRRPDGLEALLDEALALAGGDRETQASVHALRAFIINARGDHSAGEALHAKALALWETLGNQHAINSGHYNLAVSAQNAGRNGEALERLDGIVESARALHDRRRLSQSLNVRGNALSGLRRWPEAVATYRECIRLAWDCVSPHELAYGLWNLPRALAHAGQPGAALRLAAFAALFWETRFGPLSRSDERYLVLVRRLTGAQLRPERCETLWMEGRQLSPAAAVALALRSE